MATLKPRSRTVRIALAGVSFLALLLCYVGWPLVDRLYVAVAYDSASEWVVRGSNDRPYLVGPHRVKIANLPNTERMSIAGFSFKRSWVRPGNILVFRKKRVPWLPGTERRVTVRRPPLF